MKRILLLIVVIALTIGCFPACGLAGTAESPIILGGTGDDAFYGMLPLANGNLILSLSSRGGRDDMPEYDGNVYKVWLLCLAPDGSILWETNFGKEDEGGYTILQYLSLNDDDTFSGLAWYSINQTSQYRQRLTFSLADGSIVSSEDPIADTIAADHILRIYYPVNGSFIIEEICDCEVSCNPRTLCMTDAQGETLWLLDANQIGISHIDNWIPTDNGALLYGRNVTDNVSADQAVALLVDQNGNVLWTQTADIENGSFDNGIIDSNGRFIGAGLAKGEMMLDENGHFIGYDSWNQLIVCWDATTGAAYWQTVTEMTDSTLPYDNLIEIEGQYILFDSFRDYLSNVYEIIDANGQMLQYWTTSYNDFTLLGNSLFVWNNELWAESVFKDGDTDVLLERINIPETV